MKPTSGRGRWLAAISLFAAAIVLPAALALPGHADPVPTGSSRPAYDTVADEGVALQRRQVLNLIGSGVTCVDNSGQRRTDCTFSGGGGNVTSVSATSPLSSSGGTTPTISIGSAIGASLGGTGLGTYTAGDTIYASGTTSIAKLGIGANNRVMTSTGSAPAWTALGGDVSGSIGAISVDKIKGSTVTLTSPASAQLLVYSGSAWVNADFSNFLGSSIQDVGTSNSAGNSGDCAQANHVHKIGAGAINDRTMAASGLWTANEIATSGTFGWSGAHTFTKTGTALTVDNIAEFGTVSAKSGAALSLKSNGANGSTPQFTFDTANSVTGANPYLRVANAGVKVMDLQVQSSTHYLQFYDSAGSATSALVFNNAPGVYVYNATYLSPYTTNAAALGATGNRWASVWARAYYGTQQASSTSGAVSINPASGETVRVVASANITGLTVSNGTEGQHVTLIMVQDSGGTSTWPSTINNVRLAGGSFAKTTAANAIDSLSLAWDDTLSDWLEQYRATNLQ